MKSGISKASSVLCWLISLSLVNASLFGDNEKILLGKDTSALTFYKGRYTAGRYEVKKSMTW